MDQFLNKLIPESALPVDQILHSMWGSVDIKLNQKLVSTSRNKLYV